MLTTKEKIKTLISLAKNLIGKARYKYGAKPEETPNFFDCSSFIQYLYKQIGIDLPRSSILQATQGQEIKSLKELRPGDLIFIRGTKGHYDDSLFNSQQIYIGHVFMYLGNNKVINASSKEKMISEKNLGEIKEPIVMIKRILKISE